MLSACSQLFSIAAQCHSAAQDTSWDVSSSRPGVQVQNLAIGLEMVIFTQQKDDVWGFLLISMGKPLDAPTFRKHPYASGGFLIFFIRQCQTLLA